MNKESNEKWKLRQWVEGGGVLLAFTRNQEKRSCLCELTYATQPHIEWDVTLHNIQLTWFHLLTHFLHFCLLLNLQPDWLKSKTALDVILLFSLKYAYLKCCDQVKNTSSALLATLRIITCKTRVSSRETLCSGLEREHITQQWFN